MSGIENTQLGFEESRLLLEKYQVQVMGRVVQGVEDALAAAQQLGYPVVLKAVTPHIIHKTDVGAVLLNIGGASELRAAFAKLVDNATAAGVERLDGVLVQRMVEPGFEVLIGAKQDPCFGPVTMVGYGGRFVELFADVAPGVGVLQRDDVLRMLNQTRAGRILDGFRGPPLDKESVVELTMAVSRFMDEQPDILEIDLNPVIVYEHGYSIVDARLIRGKSVAHPHYVGLSWDRMKSLSTIFDPRSVAVVGASRPGTIGGIILKNCDRIDKLYPINPRFERLLGRRCYPSFSELPEIPELAVFVVNAERTVELFKQFCELGGRGAIIVSDGFAESGRPDLENRLIELGEKHGIVYIGPNGLGVIDNFSGINTMFIPARRTASPHAPSGLGVISQSGGIGLELLEMLHADNLSVGKWVSCGNASGVTIPELLAHVGDDSRIRLVAIYLEGLQNGLQLLTVGQRIGRHKPIIVIKGGVGGGAEATMSHTASLAGSFEAFRACCEKAGFFLIEELTEDPKILINIISILTTQPPARGKRVAVVSVGGGAAILLADQVTAEGMELSCFSAETRRRFGELLSGKVSIAASEEKQRIAATLGSNPVDLFGDCDDDRLLSALQILDEDPNTDVILLAAYFQVPYLSEYLPERLVELSRELTKPLIVSPRGFASYVWDTCSYLTSQNFHTYTVPMIKPLSIALDIWARYRTDFR